MKGNLDLEIGAELVTVLGKIIDGWFREGSLDSRGCSDAAPPAGGTGDPDEHTAASTWRRRRLGRRDHHQAMARGYVLDQWLGAGLAGTSHRIHPHLTITADLPDLLNGIGEGELQVPGNGVVPLPISTVSRLCCDADVAVMLSRFTTAGSTSSDAAVAGLLDHLADRSREILWLGREHRKESQTCGGRWSRGTGTADSPPDTAKAAMPTRPDVNRTMSSPWSTADRPNPTISCCRVGHIIDRFARATGRSRLTWTARRCARTAGNSVHRTGIVSAEETQIGPALTKAAVCRGCARLKP